MRLEGDEANAEVHEHYAGERRKRAKAASKTKFSCSLCGASVWGKPGTRVACVECLEAKAPSPHPIIPMQIQNKE